MSTKRASWERRYDLCDEKLGSGGNATVVLVRRKKDADLFALKVLVKSSAEKKERFKDEISIMLKCKDISGVMQIVDHGNLEKDDYWYTMPVAEEIFKRTKRLFSSKIVLQRSIVEVVQAIRSLAETLSRLHALDITHRDIKPANIYYCNGTYCFGDFGLVSFPEKQQFTRDDRGLGAIFTIAPEMKRDPKNADGKKADVYSLAKTLWMLLMRNEKGFDGEYNYNDKNISLRHNERLKGGHLVELEELLYSATRNAPEDRLDIQGFIQKMDEWLYVKGDWEKEQHSEWCFMTKLLFFQSVPRTTVWEDITDIRNVLSCASLTNNLNHTLFSDSGGGGFDLESVEAANEPGFLSLNFSPDCTCIVRPKALYLETFLDDAIWNYLRLEIASGRPLFTDESEDVSGCDEPLFEARPGRYSTKPLSGDQAPVYRYYGACVFLTVMKSSPYNLISETYDGRHGAADAVSFRNYIEQLRDYFNNAREAGYSYEDTAQFSDFPNPFQ